MTMSDPQGGWWDTSSPTGGTYITYPQTLPVPGVCPHCGHCPTCGRHNYPSNPNYWWYGNTTGGNFSVTYTSGTTNV